MFDKHHPWNKPKCSWSEFYWQLLWRWHYTQMTSLCWLSFSQQPLCWQNKVAHFLYTHSCSHKCCLLGRSLFTVSHQGLKVFWPCESEGWESVAAGQNCSVGLLRPHWVQVFSRIGVGLLEAEGNVGQNSLLTSISCCWGAQGSREEWRGGHPVDITPQQSRSVWMAGPKGLCPWKVLVFESLFGVMNRR